MDKCINGLLRFYHVAVLGLFGAILLLLGIISAYSTSYITADASEMTLFVTDSIWMNLVAAIGLLIGILAFRKVKTVQAFMTKIEHEDGYFLKWRNILLVFGFLIALIWVISTQHRAGADQAEVQKAVYMLHIKDYSMFAEDGYLAKYPNQLGLVWISYLCSLLFGSYNYLGFQLLNILGLVMIYRSLAGICDHYGLSKSGQLAVIAVCILFVPLTMYCSFVYGTVLGLACSLMAIERELSFFRKKTYVDMILSAMLIALAVLLKSNYFIFLIGMVIYAGVECLKEKSVRFVLVPVLLISCCLGATSGIKTLTANVTGYPVSQGASSWSWIAMGLQEGSRAPGWYNSYNSKSYIENEYDSAAQAEDAKQEIKRIMEGFSQDKRKAREFFTKKTASQWNNPTFQGFWNVQIRSSMITRSEPVWMMTNVNGTHIWAGFLNILQFVVLFGAIQFCALGKNDGDREKQSLLAMIIIGGFFFHLFWEAKCQYTMPYFVLLFPYAVTGYVRAAEWCEHLWNVRTLLSGKEQIRQIRRWGDNLLETRFASVVLVLVLLNIYMYAYGGSKLEYLRADTADYFEYLNEQTASPALEEGTYQIMTASGLGLAFDTENDIASIVLLNPEEADQIANEIEIINYQYDTWLRFAPELLYMTVADTSNPDKQIVNVNKSNLSASQKWKTRSTEDGGYYILYGKDHALTYHTESLSVYVSPFTGEADQIWYVQER